MSTKNYIFYGENLVYVIVLLIIHVTFWLFLGKAGFIDFDISLMIAIPAAPIAGLISVIFSLGMKKGWVKPIEKQKELRMLILVVSSILCSFTLLSLSCIY